MEAFGDFADAAGVAVALMLFVYKVCPRPLITRLAEGKIESTSME